MTREACNPSVLLCCLIDWIVLPAVVWTTLTLVLAMYVAPTVAILARKTVDFAWVFGYTVILSLAQGALLGLLIGYYHRKEASRK